MIPFQFHLKPKCVIEILSWKVFLNEQGEKHIKDHIDEVVNVLVEEVIIQPPGVVEKINGKTILRNDSNEWLEVKILFKTLELRDRTYDIKT